MNPAASSAGVVGAAGWRRPGATVDQQDRRRPCTSPIGVDAGAAPRRTRRRGRALPTSRRRLRGGRGSKRCRWAAATRAEQRRRRRVDRIGLGLGIGLRLGLGVRLRIGSGNGNGRSGSSGSTGRSRGRANGSTGCGRPGIDRRTGRARRPLDRRVRPRWVDHDDGRGRPPATTGGGPVGGANGVKRERRPRRRRGDGSRGRPAPRDVGALRVQPQGHPLDRDHAGRSSGRRRRRRSGCPSAVHGAGLQVGQHGGGASPARSTRWRRPPPSPR